MSMTILRAARLAASAALLCLALGTADAFAAAAGAGAGAAGPGAGAPGAAGNGGPPLSAAAVVLPNDRNPNRTPRWRRRHVQKARDACPLQFPRCRQDALD
jgi:hypothetical protein